MNNNTPPPSRSALYRLLIVLAIVVGILIFSTGWRITGVSLEQTQDPVRQSSLQRALSELLAPDLLDQDSAREKADARFVKGCIEGAEPMEQPTSETAPYVILSSTCGDTGDIVTVQGFNFHPDSLARVFVIRPTGNRQPFTIVGAEQAVDSSLFDVGPDGTFSVDVTVPNLRGTDGEVNLVEVEAQWPTSAPYLSKTTIDVIVKIIETIFLALIATTIAVPIAALLSFTAARNLMRQVTMPVGKMLTGFILLPIGFGMGILLLGPIATFGSGLFEAIRSQIVSFFAPGDTSFILTAVAAIGGLLVAIGIPVLLFWGYAYLTRSTTEYKRKRQFKSIQNRLLGIAFNILLAFILVFTLGAFGGVLIWLGTGLEQTTVYDIPFTFATPRGVFTWLEIQSPDLGLVLRTVGEIVGLLIVLLTGIIGAFLLTSIGMSAASGLPRRLSHRQNQALGGILGFISGGLLMAFTAWLGSLVPLFTVIPPITAAAMGAPLTLKIYDGMVNGGNYRYNKDNRTENTLRFITTLITGGIIFVLTAAALDVLAIIARERISQADIWLSFPPRGTEIVISHFIGKAMIIGAVLGGIGGTVATAAANFPLGMSIYYTSRTILNILRSIEPLIMGIVFVIWVGAGPFAGMLALGLHSIAALGKLYSEQIENIDEGPIEAVEATGANRLQTIIYAVVPQIIPPYIAFTFYRWDINVRMSTIIGFVGGGGIGFLLQQQINLLRYGQAGVAVLAIAIVVSVLDYASASIRERIT